MSQITQLSPRLNRREFSLAEIATEFSPRPIYDDGDSFVVHPLPQESPIPFGIPKTLPAFQPKSDQFTLRPVNLTIAFPLTSDLAKSFVPPHANPESYQAFYRIGHGIELSEYGPQHDSSPKYRLDLRDYPTADTFQVIVRHYSKPSPSQAPKNFHDFPALRNHQPHNRGYNYGLAQFDRYIISECDYIDYWLIQDVCGWYGDLVTPFIHQLNQYLNSFIPDA